MTEPADNAARQLIRSETGRTLFVEAGAGTGKTTELVARIVALVAAGTPITAIAAITFTEKAAAELAERVRRRLEIEAARGPAATRERFTVAVRDLDNAAIQTLHSFAMRILGLHPLEAGLPPEISLRDDVEAKLAFGERWDSFVDRLLEDPALEETLLRGLTVNLRLADLKLLAEIFNENWERLATVKVPSVAAPPLDAEAVLRPLEALYSVPRPAAEDSLTRRLDALSGFREFLRGVAERQRRPGSAQERSANEVDLLRLLSRTDPLTRSRYQSGRLGQRNNWPDVEHMRSLLEEAEEARAAMVDGVRSSVICRLLPVLFEFVTRTAEERREQGTLEFHDLLVLACSLLREHSAVRAALHQRFQRILIDEFQDTDPLQVELAALLAASPEGTPSAWQQATPEAGRLFFVGDPKQSIYRFRRADIELYKEARQGFAAEAVALTENFRSRPGIIDWVNTVCGGLFSGLGDAPDARQADWRPLEPHRGASGRSEVHLLGGPEPEKKAFELRQMEAEAIVATILKARQENWLKEGPRDKRVTRLSDIAILLPTRTNSPAIERALGEAGIPTRVESRSLLFAAQEIRDLTNILAAIDDPTDDVSVVAALRSPAFAVDDSELLAHVQAGGRWDFTRGVPEGSPESVRKGFADLQTFHEERWSASIGALVEKVIAQRKMLELAVEGPRPREAWRRLRFVSEQARALGGSGAVSSLRQFVHWLRTQASEGARIAEAVAVEPDDDAVRILTIHAAKGLEFPIVILAGLGIEHKPFAPNVAWGRDDGGNETLAIHIGRMNGYFETPDFQHYKQNEHLHSWLERDRLFYVAATRAKEHLVVSLYHKPWKNAVHSSRHLEHRCSLAECLEAIRLEHPEWQSMQVPMPLGTGVKAQDLGENTPQEREAWIAERKERIERLTSAPVRAATSVAHDDEAPPEDEVVEPSDEARADDQPWKKGRAGTSVGRAVHAVLQTIDLRTKSGLREVAASQCVAEGIAGDAQRDRVARLVESAIDSSAVQAALASGRMWREVYVATEVEGVLLEGFIDLLYETPEGLVVVDYKTDSARDAAAIDRAMERYRLQGAAYAVVLERALQKNVARCVFVFTEPRAEREVADLPAVMDEVRARISSKLVPAGR
jgi:ATP-dependent helicase/nuclease subunit A